MIEDTGKRLINYFYASYGSLVTIKGNVEETILCNSWHAPLKCDSFNGETIRTTSDLKIQHQYGCMSLYFGQPVIIAGVQSNTVETLELRFFSNNILSF